MQEKSASLSRRMTSAAEGLKYTRKERTLDEKE